MPETASALLKVDNVSKSFGIGRTFTGKPRQLLHAVIDVSFEVRAGETMGLVGESGSGKSTVARMIMQLTAPTAGRIKYRDIDVFAAADAATKKTLRRRLQMIFQDPYASLNPRLSIGKAIAEGMVIHGHVPPEQHEARVADLLSRVGLSPEFAQRYPHELSGGQRQRVGIARALAVEPEFIIGDEAVSALDVSVQAQVLNLLKDLKEQFGLTYIFISHDLRSVAFLSDRIAVLYLGRLVELCDVKTLFKAARHPYTQMLLASRFEIGGPKAGEKQRAKGEVPSALNPPPGCPFHPRCAKADAKCKAQRPPLVDDNGHLTACHYPG